MVGTATSETAPDGRAYGWIGISRSGTVRYSPRARDTRVRPILSRLATLQKIALLVYNMQSRTCQTHESRKANFRIFKANAVSLESFISHFRLHWVEKSSRWVGSLWTACGCRNVHAAW